jgi:erythromycin 3''-O-methyltransferase
MLPKGGLKHATEGISYLFAQGRGKAASSVLRYYGFFHELFDTLSERSGIFSIGYSADPSRADITEAQAELPRQTAKGLPRPGKWLDVGCGMGGPACLLASENPDVEITGINITPHHVEEANRRAKEQGLADRVSFRLGDALAMPLPDSSLDGLYAIETAFHYNGKARFIQEAMRILKPGGAFAVADIAWGGSGEGLTERIRMAPIRWTMASPELFTENQWCENLAAAGFTQIACEDISRETFGLLGRWKERAVAHLPELRQKYPEALLRMMIAGFEYYAGRPEKIPVRYILVRARKDPGAARRLPGALSIDTRAAPDIHKKTVLANTNIRRPLYGIFNRRHNP